VSLSVGPVDLHGTLRPSVGPDDCMVL
jgi:hypothetical protein